MHRNGRTLDVVPAQGRDDGNSRIRFSNSKIRVRIPAARYARVVQEPFAQEIRGRRECRTLGASAAACAVVESTRVSHHGHAGNVRHSPRNGFNGFLRALPGDRALLSPSPADTFRKLDAGVEASGPHDFAVREVALSSLAPPASTASRPASVTIASAPLGDGMARDIEVIWAKGEGEYFWRRDWTAGIKLNRFNKFRRARRPGWGQTGRNATSQARMKRFRMLSFRGSPNGAEPGIQGFPDVQLHI
jgi:hypothetical protein